MRISTRFLKIRNVVPRILRLQICERVGWDIYGYSHTKAGKAAIIKKNEYRMIKCTLNSSRDGAEIIMLFYSSGMIKSSPHRPCEL